MLIFVQLLIRLLVIYSSVTQLYFVSAVKSAPWKLINSVYHNSTCFTQGLIFDNPSRLIESCGLYGQSRIETYSFESFNSGKSYFPFLIETFYLNKNLFAEGLTLANDKLYVLTWREHHLLVLDKNSLSFVSTLEYPLHGWGLAYSGKDNIFYATDGSNFIYKLAISNTNVIILSHVSAVCNGASITNLNELEIIDNVLYANVWYSNIIYGFLPETGECVSKLNLSDLAEEENGVMNGIAAVPADFSVSTDYTERRHPIRLWITGKNWNSMHLIEFDGKRN